MDFTLNMAKDIFGFLRGGAKAATEAAPEIKASLPKFTKRLMGRGSESTITHGLEDSYRIRKLRYMGDDVLGGQIGRAASKSVRDSVFRDPLSNLGSSALGAAAKTTAGGMKTAAPYISNAANKAFTGKGLAISATAAGVIGFGSTRPFKGVVKGAYGKIVNEAILGSPDGTMGLMGGYMSQANNPSLYDDSLMEGSPRAMNGRSVTAPRVNGYNPYVSSLQGPSGDVVLGLYNLRA